MKFSPKVHKKQDFSDIDGKQSGRFCINPTEHMFCRHGSLSLPVEIQKKADYGKEIGRHTTNAGYYQQIEKKGNVLFRVEELEEYVRLRMEERDASLLIFGPYNVILKI
ncbi:hypothetical protein [Bacteroides acidifaciens]|uniref:hypothetical protein n=1 Tax=Bacteroides acidifaciens TaxID=85831 RepID=UPI003F68F6DA